MWKNFSFSFIRHELKTPINAIIGYSEMLLEETEDVGEAATDLCADLDRIRSAGQEMLVLVNALKAEVDPRNSGPGFREAIRAMIDTVVGCAGNLLERAEDGGIETFTGDLIKIQNAGKQLFTLVEDFAKSGNLKTCIDRSEDAGAGPPPPDIHPAVPADNAAGREHAVSGEILATILVVDDNEMNRDLLSRQLIKQGYAFDIAVNGRAAIDMMRMRQFDLVLMDVLMPEMDGMQALEEIKADPALRHTPVIMVSSLDEMDKIVWCIEKGAEDYLPKPPDPVLLNARLGACLEKKRLIDQEIETQKTLKELNKALDVRNRLIRETFGRYLSDEIVENILETPAGLKLGGEKRRITILMSDLRGFTSIAEQLSPEEVVAMINNYLEVMTGVIMKYNGTIDEFIGDAILALFGAPVQREDDALRAVACAVEMQTAMEEVNKLNRAVGYPEVFMGIGINTGSVVVGNIGCSKRVKYGVVGKNVNLTSRIESYSVGGQILISGATLEDCQGDLRIERQMEIMPKGVREPITIYEVGGVGGKFNVALKKIRQANLVELGKPLPVRFAVIEGKHSGARLYQGAILRAHRREADILSEILPEEFSNLRIYLEDNLNETSPELFAKVTGHVSSDPQVFRIHYTYLSPEADRFLSGIIVPEPGE